MPRYQAGTDINIWKADVRAMKHRVCSGIPINRTSSFASRMHTNTLLMPKTPSCSPFNLNLSAAGQVFWTGNVAVNSATDSSCTQGNQYTEADTMYFVPCVASGSPSGFESSWVGLGGVNGANLVQTGTESDSGGTYYAWTENVGAANHQDWLFSVNCGDRIQVKAFHSNETTIQDFNNGDYNDTAYGPAASYNTAEWIVERTEQCDIFGNNCTPGPLADFQSETFYGLGTTLRSGAYLSPNDIDHDYSNMGGKTNIGPLAHNTLYGPPDYSNTITWVHQ